MDDVKNALIKLGQAQPSLRTHIRPILDELRRTMTVRKANRELKDQLSRLLNEIEGAQTALSEVDHPKSKTWENSLQTLWKSVYTAYKKA